MNTRTTMMALGLLVALAALSCPSWAAGDAETGSDANLCAPPLVRLVTGNLGRLLVLRSELGLTGEQRKKIATIVKGHREEIRPVAKGILEKRHALRETVMTQPTNEANVRKAAADLGVAIGDAAMVASRVVAKARNVLSPEQVERIKQFRASCDDAAAEWVTQIGK